MAASRWYTSLVSYRQRHSLSAAVLRRALRGTWREARATAKDQDVRARDFALRR
jgi:hypothetical protein